MVPFRVPFIELACGLPVVLQKKHMNIFYKIFLLGGLLSGQVFGQSEEESPPNRHQLYIQLGGQYTVLKDYNFSRLHYKQHALVYGLGYEKRSKNGNRIFQIQGQFLTSTLEPNPTSIYQPDYRYGQLRIGLLKRLLSKENPFQIYIGGVYQTQVDYINYNDQEAFSFLINHGIYLKGQAEYVIHPKGRIYTALSFPLLTLMVRPPYTGFNEVLQDHQDRPLQLLTNGIYRSLGTYMALYYQLSYRYKIHKGLNLQIGYQFTYQNLKADAVFVSGTHQCLTQFILQF